MKFGHEFKSTTNSDFGDIFAEDWFIAILICIGATIGWMVWESGTVICVENACYLHVHSFMCYLLWSVYNTFIGFSIYLIIEFLTGKAIKIQQIIVIRNPKRFSLFCITHIVTSPQSVKTYIWIVSAKAHSESYLLSASILSSESHIGFYSA